MLPTFQSAASVKTVWGMIAVAIVALFFLSRKQRGKASRFVWAVAIGIIILALVSILGWLQLQREGAHERAIYHLRVTVLDPQQIPVNDARVWSSIDAIPKKVDGGWEFSIPAGSKPVDGKLIVYAQVQNVFWMGRQAVALSGDYYPSATILLRADDRAQIRGIVEDATGKGIAGARVSVVGYSAETVTTKEDGGFVLPAHAADGQQVELHVKVNHRALDQWHPAGKSPATLVVADN